jgi:hypothetical protein
MPVLSSAPKPGKPGPGRPPGSRNRRPATRHDVGKTAKPGELTKKNPQANRLNVKLRGFAEALRDGDRQGQARGEGG